MDRSVTGLRGLSRIRPSLDSGGSQAKERPTKSSKPRSRKCGREHGMKAARLSAVYNLPITKMRMAERGRGMGTTTYNSWGITSGVVCVTVYLVIPNKKDQWTSRLK